MARIRIYRNEANGEYFPRLCMKCGQPAERDVPQSFAWMPGWVHLLLLAGLLPWLIVCLVTRKTMRIVAPMCHQHAGHWAKRKLFVWLGLLFWIACAVCLALFSDYISKETMTALILGLLGGALVWLIIALVLTTKAIHPIDIRDKGMELANVNRSFADAWNDRFE